MIYKYRCLVSEFGFVDVVMTARCLFDAGVLTNKQYIVFRLYVIEQLGIYEISYMLDRDKSTISRHLRNIYNKLYEELHNR